MALEQYQKKRDFQQTPEPAGTVRRRKKPAAALSFVVQKHAARRLHYDFRLELDGVLLSWAIPRGPSLDPAAKRLAVRTEDHPIEYGDFEGVIPEGEYGGGAVIVWDRGRWQPEGDARDALRRGRLTFTLEGEKLAGRFHLIRTRGEGRAENWLFFRGKGDGGGKDGGKDGELTEREPRSVLSGRTLEEVAEARDRVWRSNRAASADLTALIGALPKKLSSRVKLTNLDKVLYPEQGLTKAAIIAYLAVVAERMLPLCADRPLMLLRCPDGQHRQCF